MAAFALVCTAACSTQDLAQQQPENSASTPTPVPPNRPSKLDKIDLLFVIDNSPSMADKQEVLAVAVPDLVNRFVNPRCTDGNPADTSGKCAKGHKREFDPVLDIHIGVISSSLGGHGADSCSNVPTVQYDPRMEDMSHLVERADAIDPTKKESTWDNQGFLAWDPKAKYNPPGDSNVHTLKDKFTHIVRGTGQDGCGFEASQEAWYRFLVDPAPYQRMVPYDCNTYEPAADGACRGPEGIDQVVLSQRQAFLRPDSLVAIILLSDEDDCSVIDGWQNYLALQAYAGTKPFHLPRAASICESDPTDPLCMSCAQGDHAADPKCKLGSYGDLEDNLNLRCYRQKQRFGVDFLYPVRRYVNGLTKKRFDLQDVEFNPGFRPDKDYNPLFCTRYGTLKDGVTPDPAVCQTVLRDPSLIFFAAIVGVPWQDIARDPGDLKKGYRPVEELGWTKTQFDVYNNNSATSEKRFIPPGVTETATVWDQILGKIATDPKSPARGEIDWRPGGEPLDPLMIESIEPRSGINPATGAGLEPPSSSSPVANPVNGHEWDIPARNDLQFACTFPLPQPRDCAGSAPGCDCGEGGSTNNPLCQSPSGTYGTTQFRAKAYPGRRHLAVLRGLEPNQAIAASICPANLVDPTAADFGYRPAINAIVDRLRTLLSSVCQGALLEADPDGTVPCRVLEASKYPEGTSQCPACETMAWRTTPSSELITSVEKDVNYIENDLKCICEIPQAPVGAELTACIESRDVIPTVDGQPVDGWCYVDPASHPGANDNLVQGCAPNAKRTIRFVGEGLPREGTLTFLRCEGKE